ncbi:DNA protecting protein DprA [Pseudoflavonifractor capillosus ATCC 29799]|uniref:DNA protecting protein DprA n=1 Tax=Pseudoflavonifractor capillosus ATCC 29799 TaxID=411467 RepID=A6P2C9_9FIRM|nr:DNA-processing protein DprA [Pseudoflavonifractor capillosus]EDM97516.1 DNA protecting protein DprA [Pseudoflavonifractor capillosus ATCC 29799]
MAALKYWIWLTTRRGMTPLQTFRLLDHFGTPEAAYFADRKEYRLCGLTDWQQRTLLDKSLDGAERILGDCDRLGIRILTIQDAEYPERLRQIENPPCVLYVKGKLFPFDELVTVGVVGTRRPTEYGKIMAGRLGMELARGGALVVSGIARGLDAAALRGALKGGGSVVSVLGGGIDVVYPAENRWLYEDVAAAGALISEYPPGTENKGEHFPIRNRIISGLSLGVAAVEAEEHSGTLITMRLALDQGRDAFAVPGNADAPMSRGTNLLIQRGEAKLVLSGWDILCEYEQLLPGRVSRPEPLPVQVEAARLEVPEPPQEPERQETVTAETVDKPDEMAYITLEDGALTDDERDILLALEGRGLRTDDLVELTQIPARRVSSALTMLQIHGYVEEKAGRRFESTVVLKRE